MLIQRQEMSHPIVWRRALAPAFLPDVEVGVRFFAVHRLLEPLVLVGRVVGNKVEDHLEAPVLHAGQQFLEERQVPVF
jgi:hypothetical protein